MKNIIIITLLVITAGVMFAVTPYQLTTAAGVAFYYRVTDDLQNLDCQLHATTTGWVAVGFAPTNIMENANIIIGYDANGVTNIRDDWGTGVNSHASDTSLGGTTDIVQSTSSEAEGITVLNFFIPLNSGDSFDRVLQIGQTYDIILALGANGEDNFTQHHAAAGFASITVTQPVANDDEVIVQPDSDLSLQLAPNPFNNNLGIRTESKSSSPLTITVYDSKGREIKQVTASANTEINLNAENYPAGIYFIKASGNAGSIVGKALKLR